MSTVIVSVNPKAGRRNSASRVDSFVQTLQKEFGFEVEVKTDLAEVAQRANELFEAGTLHALVGVGGDGTAAELTNRTVPGVPLSLLPSGTANLMAKQLKYSTNPVKMARIIGTGTPKSFDAANVNGHLFLAMVGCGFDAEVVNQVHTARMNNPKGAHINYLSYTKPILKAIGGYKYPKLKVSVLNESGELEKEVVGCWTFICNIPRYGWGVPLAPKAVPNDGELDLCVFRPGSLFAGLILTSFAQMFGAHRFLPGCTMLRGKRFRVEPADSASELVIPFQFDGDPGGNIPVDVEVMPGRLTMITK